MQGTRYPCRILIKLEFSRQIFEKSSNIKFHENPYRWESSCSMRTDGRTDRHDETNSRFSQFRERA